MPAQFTWANGGESVGLIPARYPGTTRSTDPLLQLGRRTEWQEVAGVTVGLGQRMLATDAGEFALLDVRQILLQVTDAALADQSGGTHG
jgi:type VI secretion system protein ImpE